MSIRTVNVWHRLNASEEGGRAVVSLDVVDAQRNVPPQILCAVDELLDNIAPAGETTAYAVKRFVSPGEIGSFVCLVASHLYVDRWKRRAALNHARILHVDSGDPWLDVHELVELAVAFESDNALVMTPEGIRDRVLQVENNVQVTEWSELPFEEVERALAQTVIEICISRVSNPEPIAVPLPPQSSTLVALRGAAAAWASLPMAIQRASEFSIDAKKGTRVKILFTTAAGNERQPTVTQQTRDFAASYIQWLHDSPDDARALVLNPDVNDGPTLLRAFERARAPMPIPRDGARDLTMNAGISEAAPLVSEFYPTRAPQTMQREERTMAKNKRPAEGPRRELDPAVTSYINQQVAAAEESLRESMKKWTGAVQQGIDRASVPRDPGGMLPPSSPFPRRWSEIAAATGAGVVGGVLAAWLTVLMMRPHTNVPASRPDRAEVVATQTLDTTTRQDAAPAVQPRTPFESLTGATWAEKFQTLSNNDPKRLASVVDSLVTSDPDTKTTFGKLHAQIASGKVLADNDRKLLRVILYQMLAQQFGGSDFKIDGKFESVPPADVAAVRDSLNLESTKTSTDGDIANVEAEAILRWAARRGL